MNGRDVRSRRGVPFPYVFRSDLGFNSLLKLPSQESPVNSFPRDRMEGPSVTSSSGGCLSHPSGRRDVQCLQVEIRQ